MDLSTDTCIKCVQGPIATREEYTHFYHQKEFKDSYHWLRDDTRSNERVLEYLRRENNYTIGFISAIKPTVDVLYDEISAYEYIEDNFPFRVGDYTYMCDKKGGLSKYTRKSGNKEVLVKDFNEYPESTLEGAFEPSPDNNKVAFTIDKNGTEEYQLIVRDLKTMDEKLVSTKSCDRIVWSPDSNYIFYTIRNENWNPFRLMRYSLKFNTSDVFYEEKSKEFTIEFYSSTSKRFLFLKRGTATSSETYSLEITNPYATLELVTPFSANRIYTVDHQEDHFIIVTNRHNNKRYPNFALFKAPIADPNNWISILKYKPTEYITAMYSLENTILLEVLIDGVQYIKYIHNDKEYIPEFGEKVFHAKIYERQLHYTAREIQIIYSSPITPTTLYELDLNSHNIQLDLNHNQSQYQVERIFTKKNVPITLVYNKHLKAGDNPLLLEGYGAYGLNLEPKYRHDIFSLLNRGFIYAMAHVRGGKEKGERWHKNGMLLKKRNSFTDFAECAKHLRSLNISSYIAAQGSSAGGLLVAAAINQNPDLFQAAILNVPFVDVLNSMMDSTLPLTIFDYQEWGNPNNITYFNYISKYSPYENIPPNPKAFPDLFVRSSLNDNRVQYWEPAKYVAQARYLTSCIKPKILHAIDMENGHLTGNLNIAIRQVAEEYAFLMATMH